MTLRDTSTHTHREPEGKTPSALRRDTARHRRDRRPAGRAALRLCALLLALLSLPLPRLQAQINADIVVTMGRNALSVDDYVTAIRYFNQAIEAKPFLSQPYYYRAYAKFTLEDYAGAEADCTQSIELNPFIPEVYQLRGLCRINLAQYTAAAADYTSVLRDMPDEQGAIYNRALCYLHLQDYDRADADLDHLLRKYPGYYRTYLIKAQVALERADTLAGLHWMDSLLVKSPAEEQAWSFKGRYALSKGEYAQADSFLTRAVTLRPQSFDNYLARAEARHALGRFALSLQDYDKVISLVPEHFVAHYNRGLLRSFTGDLNRAIADFDFVLSKEPDNTLARYNRAQLRAKTGNYRGAAADYTAIIREYPNFTYGYSARAECRRKMGDTRGALSDETVVAKRSLDIAYGRPKRGAAIRKVRKRSDHALEQYQQLISSEEDTVRTIMGNLYGKVQNTEASGDLLPAFLLAFCPANPGASASSAFVPEAASLTQADSPARKLRLTTQTATTASEAEAATDEKRVGKASPTLTATQEALMRSAIHAARYDYNSALNEANRAVRSDTASALALIQRAAILTRSLVSAQTAAAPADFSFPKNPSTPQSLAAPSSADGEKPLRSLDLADLARAARLSPASAACAAYNAGCLHALNGAADEAIAAFSEAIAKDPRMGEAHYNRALLLLRKGRTNEAQKDLSRAGELGVYKAYAQLKNIKKESPQR